MQKFLVSLLVFFGIFLLNTQTAAAEISDSDSENYELSAEDFGTGSVVDALPEETYSALEEQGITPDNSGALGLNFWGVISGIWELVRSRAGSPTKLFCSLFGVVLLCAAAENFSETGGLKEVFPAVGVLCGAGIAAFAISGVLSETLTALGTAANFTAVFVPVFTGICAAMGYVSSAAAVNSVTLAATQVFSQLAVNFLAPMCGTILGVSVTGAVHPALKLEKIGDVIKKIVTWGLALLMTVFMALLSAQTLVTAASDNAAIKAAKFMVSQGVPIVGGTISDAVNMLGGGISTLKGSVGSYGMIAGAAVLLPALVTVTLYRIALFLAQSSAEIFGLKELAALFKSCCSVMSIVFAVTVCFGVMTALAALMTLFVCGG